MKLDHHSHNSNTGIVGKILRLLAYHANKLAVMMQCSFSEHQFAPIILAVKYSYCRMYKVSEVYRTVTVHGVTVAGVVAPALGRRVTAQHEARRVVQVMQGSKKHRSPSFKHRSELHS
jgi:hypothetical protein